MVAAIEVRYEDDTENPVAGVTSIHVKATDLDNVTVTTVDDEQVRTEHLYYFQVLKGSTEVGRSHVFSPSVEGDAYWDDYTFADDGAHTVKVMEVGTPDTQAATASVTVDPQE